MLTGGQDCSAARVGPVCLPTSLPQLRKPLPAARPDGDWEEGGDWGGVHLLSRPRPQDVAGEGCRGKRSRSILRMAVAEALESRARWCRAQIQEMVARWRVGADGDDLLHQGADTCDILSASPFSC